MIDNLRKWQKHTIRRRIPLDVFLSLCKFTSVFYKIKGLRLNRARTYLNINYPIKLTESFAFISECIRVEGHLTKKRIVIENTNTEFTSRLKEGLKKIGIKEGNIKESLHIKIQVPENIPKEDIKIINLANHKKIKHFYERTLNLKLGDKKEVIFTENRFSYNKKQNYKMFYENKSFVITFKIPTNGKIYANSTLNDTRYQKACISLKIEVWNKTLAHILHKVFEIPYGNKSRIIKIPDFVKNSPKNTLKKIIIATLAAESTVATKNRFIAICSLSKDYLNDFQQILKRFNINSQLGKNSLRISGIKNFRRINENFDLIIKTKKRALGKLLKIKMEQSQKGLAKLFYLKSLEELKRATSIQIRNNNKRTGNSFRKYIRELLNEEYIRLVKEYRPKEYILTEKGKNLLNENRDLLR